VIFWKSVEGGTGGFSHQCFCVGSKGRVYL
jgi:hypothetical protein